MHTDTYNLRRMKRYATHMLPKHAGVVISVSISFVFANDQHRVVILR